LHFFVLYLIRDTVFASNRQNNALMDFYDIIKDRRVLLNIIQKDLADISSVSLWTNKAIEKANGNPSIDTLRKIADALGLELIMKVREIPKL
jgi:transcriptional regulator with XRE-family HTH domain